MHFSLFWKLTMHCIYNRNEATSYFSALRKKNIIKTGFVSLYIHNIKIVAFSWMSIAHYEHILRVNITIVCCRPVNTQAIECHTHFCQKFYGHCTSACHSAQGPEFKYFSICSLNITKSSATSRSQQFIMTKFL